MPPATAPTASWEESRGRIGICIAGSPIVSLSPGDGRVGIGLVMPGIGRVIDVSVQPNAACRTLDEAARRAGVPTGAVDSTALSALARACERAGAWTAARGLGLLRGLGGAAFPLLGGAYDEGAAPLAEVPRWAVPTLSARSIGDAAAIAFGDRATRPVRRALVEAIRPLECGSVDLAALAFALMGVDVLQPDRLARVLAAPRVLQPSADLPDPATLRTTRRVVNSWGDLRTERVLLDAAGRADGMAMLLRTAEHARQLGDHGPPAPLPNRLVELHDVHRALLRSVPAVHAEPVRRPRRAVAPAPRPRPAERPTHRALAPQAALTPVGPSTPLPTSRTVRALAGRGAGDLSLVLPHTAGDLARWGRLLSNCLGDFGASAAAGRSVIVGVLRANQLVSAVELTPDGLVRQFCGRANRAPADHHRREVMRLLVQGCVVDARAARNHPWLSGVELPPASTRAS